jgi:hypothetical protein
MIGVRRSFRLLLSLVLICVTAASCSAPVPSEEIGVTLHFRGSDESTVKRQFDLMAAMNVRWVRVDLDWSVIEAEQSRFDWAYPDMVVDEAVARRMNVLVVLGFSPAWTRSTASHRSRPDDPFAFANFARVAAARYAALGVHSWEIWNEPNAGTFWAPQPDADEYGSLFRSAAEAIRSIDPDATLLIGGLAPKFDVQEAVIPPAEYLGQLYANGTATLADGIAAHPYSFPAMPTEDRQRMIGGFADLPSLRAVMEAHGDGEKKIWITEFGAPTGTGPYAVSEEDQAAALLQALDQTGRWDWAGPLIYYELVDGGRDLADPEQNFGVLHEDLAPKPAAVALMDNA